MSLQDIATRIMAKKAPLKRPSKPLNAPKSFEETLWDTANKLGRSGEERRAEPETSRWLAAISPR